MPNIQHGGVHIVDFPTEPDTPHRDYIDSMGVLMEGMGQPPAVGRLFAYLLLRTHPASLDDMCADLGISKSSASVAARQLLAGGVVRRIRRPSSRRLLYQATDTLETLLEAELVMRATLLEKFRQALDLAGPGAPRARVEALVSLYEWVITDTRDSLRRWKLEWASSARRLQTRA